MLTSKQSNSKPWNSFWGSAIPALVIHEVLTKLRSEIPLHKNKNFINLCAKLSGKSKPFGMMS